ncbi:MAG: response regulator transcription factor [Pseudomonadota bacterium]
MSEPSPHLLLAEDDASLGAAVRDALEAAGYRVSWTRTGDAAANAWASAPSLDLVILDLGLPGLDGLEVLEKARRGGLDTPVLVLTARDGPEDRVRGLDAGADDYLVKPFHLAELLARIRARLRRDAGGGEEPMAVGGLQLTQDPRGAQYLGRAVSLTASEYDLLECLLRQAGRVMPRDRLEAVLARSARTPGSNTLDVYIHRLRRKLDASVIRTVHGIGYVLEAPNPSHDEPPSS